MRSGINMVKAYGGLFDDRIFKFLVVKLWMRFSRNSFCPSVQKDPVILIFSCIGNSTRIFKYYLTCKASN